MIYQVITLRQGEDMDKVILTLDDLKALLRAVAFIQGHGNIEDGWTDWSSLYDKILDILELEDDDGTV